MLRSPWLKRIRETWPLVRKPAKRAKPAARPQLLQLEDRLTPTISISGYDALLGQVNFTGDGANDVLVLANVGGVLEYTANGVTGTDLDAAPGLQELTLGTGTARQITVNLDGGDDQLTLNNSWTFNHRVVFDGGTGSDSLLGTDNGLAWLMTGGKAGDLGTGADNLSFVGVDSLVAGSGYDTMTGENANRIWTVDATSTYDIGAGQVTFSGMEDLEGGSANDTFNLNVSSFLDVRGNSGDDTFVVGNFVTIFGAIDGGTNTNTLNYSTGSTSFLVQLTGSTGTGYSGYDDRNNLFNEIDTIVGGSDAFDLVIGEDLISTWTVNNTSTYNDGTTTLTFSGFEFLDGGNQDDTFNVSPLTAHAITINGGDPSTPTGDTLNMDLTGTTGASLSLLGLGAGQWSFNAPHQSVAYYNIETTSTTGGTYDLVLDMTAAGFADGFGDYVEVKLNGAATRFQVYVGNSVPVLPLFFEDNFASINSFSMIGSGDDEGLIVNSVNGRPIPPSDISFAGNGGIDRLQMKSGAADSVVYTPDAILVGKGVVAQTNGVNTKNVNFTGLEGVDVTGMLSAKLVTPNGADSVTVVNGNDFMTGLTPAVRTSGSSNGVSFTPLAVWGNTAYTLDTGTNDAGAGGPNDTVNVTSASAAGALTNWTINTGATGVDQVNINGPVTVGADLLVVTRSIAQTAGAVNVAGIATLNADTSGVNQSGGTLLADKLRLLGTGTFNVSSAGNDVNTFAASVAGNVSFADSDGFDIGTVGATNGANTGVGNTLTLSLGSGTVTQSQPVTTSKLELLGTGDFTLTGASNSIGTLAGSLVGNVDLNTASALIVGIAGSSTGIATGGGHLVLTTTGASGTLAVNQNVASSGGNVTFHTSKAETLAATVDAGLGTIWLDPVSGGVNQTAGSVKAANLLVTSADNAAVSLPQLANVVPIIAAQLAGGSLTFKTTGPLSVNQVNSTVGIVTGFGLPVSGNGGNVDLSSTLGLTVDKVIDTTPSNAGFGTLTIGGGVTLNAAVNVGKGDVTLNGGGLDIYINSNQSFPVNVALVAPRDVVIRAVLQTTQPASGNLTIKGGTSHTLAGVGNGGVWIDSTGGFTGQVISAGFLTISGKDLFGAVLPPTPTSLDAVRIEGPIQATGLITISTDLTGTPGPAGAGTFLGSSVDSAITTGAAVNVNNPVFLDAASSVTSKGGNLTFASTIDGGFALTLDAKNGGASSGNIVVTGNTGASTQLASVAITNANNATFTGTIATTGNVVQAAGTGLTTLNGSGAGSIGGLLDLKTANVTLNNALTVVGPVNLTVTGTGNVNGTVAAGTSTVTLTGGAFNLNTANRFSSGANPVVLVGNTTVNLLNNNQQFGSLASSVIGLPINLQLVNLGTATLTTGNASNTEFDGVLTGASGKLTKQGSGNFTLGNSNTYTGATTINGGTVTLGVNNVFADASTITINNGATLAMNGKTDTVAGVTLVDGNINGPGTLTSASTFLVQNGTISANLAGATAAVGLTKSLAVNPLNTVVLSGVTTYGGNTTIASGTFTVAGPTGKINGATGTVLMTGANTILNGSGEINVPGGVVVNALGVTIGAAGVQGSALKIKTGTTGVGVTVNSTGSAYIVGNTIQTGTSLNGVAIDVFGGKALIQDNDLSNPGSTTGAFYGLRARSNGTLGAQVDAGQFTGSSSFVLTGISSGNNKLTGYQDYTGATNPSTLATKISQAILNQNANNPNSLAGPKGKPSDLYAQKNDFGYGYNSANYTQVEKKIYHDVDFAGVGFVNYTAPASLNPTLLATRFYSVDATEAVAQRSMIRRVRFAFDQPVNIAPGGITLTFQGNPVTGGGPAVNTAIALSATLVSFDPGTGQFLYEFGFATGQPGVESSGSLVDGRYKLSFDPTKITSVADGVSQVTPASTTDVKFWRLFGDLNGNGWIDAPDIAAFNAALGKLSNQPGYNRDFDYNNDGSIDSATDLVQFNLRKNAYNSAGNSLFW